MKVCFCLNLFPYDSNLTLFHSVIQTREYGCYLFYSTQISMSALPKFLKESRQFRNLVSYKEYICRHACQKFYASLEVLMCNSALDLTISVPKSDVFFCPRAKKNL